jgi:hypothetical protein
MKHGPEVEKGGPALAGISADAERLEQAVAKCQRQRDSFGDHLVMAAIETGTERISFANSPKKVFGADSWTRRDFTLLQPASMFSGSGRRV